MTFEEEFPSLKKIIDGSEIGGYAKDEILKHCLDKAKVKKLDDAAEMLWVVVANASQGDWSKQTEEWQTAAAKWRDNYFKVRKELGL